MSIKLTTAYWKIKKLNNKIKVIQGGQAGGKTWAILTIIFEKALTSKIRATIVTESYPQLRDGVIADMKTIVTDAGLIWSDHYNQGSNNLTLYDSLIEFRNIDNKDFHRAKGARRNILFINEANRTNFATVEQMITRTSDEIFIDYNPDREFWVHTEMVTRPDVDFIILTYKDNECIDPGEKAEIESRRNKPDWWRVYGEGQLGTYSDRRIYSYQFYKELPKTAKKIPYGIDFGISPDPTTLVELHLDGNKLYANEVFCLNNLMPEKISGAERMAIVDQMQLSKIKQGEIIIADSAGATEIKDLRANGYNVYPVHKSPGSVIAGINQLRGYDLFISENSTNLKNGIESYFFQIDKNNKIIPEPDGHEPDGLAAIRYVIMEKNRIWAA